MSERPQRIARDLLYLSERGATVYTHPRGRRSLQHDWYFVLATLQMVRGVDPRDCCGLYAVSTSIGGAQPKQEWSSSDK